MKTRVRRLDGQGDIRVEAPGPGQVLLRMAAGGIRGSGLRCFQHAI